MKIVLSDHATSQRIERKIPKKFILETVKNPQTRLKNFRNRELLQRRFSDKILEAVMVVDAMYIKLRRGSYDHLKLLPQLF